MQGERGAGNSFSESIDLNQGSVPSNNSPSQTTAWNSMLYPMDNHNVQSFGGWHIGESSSSSSPNLQSQGLGGNLKNENPLDTLPPVGPSNSLLRESRSSRIPLDINLNSEDMASGSGEDPDTVDTFPYNIENHDGASSSSFGDWGSIKRKALDGASSNSFQLDDTFGQHDFHARSSGSGTLSTYSPSLHPPRFNHSEELSLRMGIGRGLASDAFPPISVTETGESSSRNYGVRVNHGYDPNLPSTRNSMSLSDFCNRFRSSRAISPSETFEFRPVTSNSRSQSQSVYTPDLPRNMPPFALHGDSNTRTGGSSRSTMISAERGFSPREEGNSASITRNALDRSPLAHFADIRNNLNLSPENVGNSASHSSSLWATPQHHGLSRNTQRSSQFNPWDQFPPADSELGNWRGGQFPPLRSGASSSEEMMMSSGVNQGHHHHTPFPRSSMMELPGDDVSGWHALAADIEGRQRLVSEIRHVLNAMRRGDNLRDEDYMLFDPFINGMAEFHDRHRDMRLDVDNMSYEELLALEERIGDVNTGLSEEAILRSMKQRKYICLFDRSSSTLEPCSICRDEYSFGDDVGELDCGHDFHIDCIKQWLTQKNICPICKMTALGT